MDKFYIPASILLAGVAVAGAFFYTQTPVSNSGALRIESNPRVQQDEITPERTLALVNPMRSLNRRVYGSEEAKITVVEFSDFECPFCARVHPTLKRLVEESNAEVAWEYRHLPLSIHKNAEASAVAAECVGELSGNDAFWQFGDFLFQNQTRLSQSLYIEGANTVGVLTDELMSCMEREDILNRVIEDSRTAVSLGGGGTPFSVIVYEDGSTRTVPGALPYEQFKALVQK